MYFDSSFGNPSGSYWFKPRWSNVVLWKEKLSSPVALSSLNVFGKQQPEVGSCRWMSRREWVCRDFAALVRACVCVLVGGRQWESGTRKVMRMCVCVWNRCILHRRERHLRQLVHLPELDLRWSRSQSPEVWILWSPCWHAIWYPLTHFLLLTSIHSLPLKKSGALKEYVT